MLNFGKWLLAGSVGGVAGAAVWAAIAYFANAEVGWIAWGIGAAVGVCVRFIAGESQEGWGPGLAAVLIAVLSVLGGKYAAVSMAVAAIAAGAENVVLTDEEMIASLADDTVRDLEEKGQEVAFPAGKSLDTASVEADYPPAIWKAASQQWSELGPAKQQEQRAATQQALAALMGNFREELHAEAFASSFGIYDMLWFGLAAFTAFRIGAGNVSSDGG